MPSPVSCFFAPFLNWRVIDLLPTTRDLSACIVPARETGPHPVRGSLFVRATHQADRIRALWRVSDVRREAYERDLSPGHDWFGGLPRCGESCPACGFCACSLCVPADNVVLFAGFFCVSGECVRRCNSRLRWNELANKTRVQCYSHNIIENQKGVMSPTH